MYSIPQFRALVILSNRGPGNLATLAGLLGVQPSAAGRLVDRLVSAGLIDRPPHPHSPRGLLAALTSRGPEVVRKVTSHRRVDIARIVERMPPSLVTCPLRLVGSYSPAVAGARSPAVVSRSTR